MKKGLAAAFTLLLAASAFAVVPSTDSYLLSIGRGKGACVTPSGGGAQICSQWRTTVWIYNASQTDAANVTIYLLLRQVNNNPDSRQVTVQPGETREFTDILGDNFGVSDSQAVFGAFRFVSDQPVVVTGRIFDANVTVVGKDEVGTAGQFFPGTPTQLAISGAGSTSVIGLAESTTWRTNMFVVETTGNSVNFQVQRVDPSGNVMASFSDSVGAREARQYNKILQAKLGASSTTNQRLVVTITGGSGALLVGASFIDNRTGDPSTVEMVTASAVPKTTGLFEGVVRGVGSPYVDGGIALTLTSAGIPDISGNANISCTNGPVAVDFSQSFSSSPITINPDGTFQATYSIEDYQDPNTQEVILHIDWTLQGQMNSDGVLIGTLQSQVTFAGGDYADCANAADQSNWRAAWVAAQ
jgi:hypothetical protein